MTNVIWLDVSYNGYETRGKTVLYPTQDRGQKSVRMNVKSKEDIEDIEKEMSDFLERLQVKYGNSLLKLQ